MYDETSVCVSVHEAAGKRYFKGRNEYENYSCVLCQQYVFWPTTPTHLIKHLHGGASGSALAWGTYKYARDLGSIESRVKRAFQ